MVVRKILEATLIAGSTSITFTDTDIPNSLLRVYCTRSSLFPISQTLSGNSVTVTYKPQDSNIGVALEIVKSGLDIVDDLLTDDSTKALSASQGYILKGLIDDITIPENITDLDDVRVTSIQNGQVLAWNSTIEKFENVNQSGISGDDYSTIETVIGKWVDDRNIYRKCFVTTSSLLVSNSNWTSTGISIPNGDGVIKAYMLRNTDGGQSFPLIAGINNGNLQIEICWSGASLSMPAGSVIMVDYIKTS